VRADAGADQVVRRLDVRDPVADRLARCLLQRARAELDGQDLGAEQPHPLDVRALPAHVLRAHVDDALEPEPGADGRSGDAVLSRSRLGDDAPLAEPDREQRLAKRVVDLVRAGVAQVLALEQDPLPGRREARGLVQRRGPAHVAREQVVELGVEAAVGPRLQPAALELVERGDQRLRHVATAVGPVEACAHRAAATYARMRS
jgi:hypothetical protein